MTNRTLQKNHHASPTPSAGIQPSLRWLAYPGLLAAAFVVTCGMTRFLDRPPVAPPGTPAPPAEQLQPGSLVFTPPDAAVPFNDMSRWW
jgi:hypothetical protein